MTETHRIAVESRGPDISTMRCSCGWERTAYDQSIVRLIDEHKAVNSDTESESEGGE